MLKYIPLISVLALVGCDDNSQLSADQQFQLKQMQIKQQHELDMARATHPAPVIQSQYEEHKSESYPSNSYDNVVRSDNGNTGSIIGSHVASAAVGAAAGYYAGKHLSNPQTYSKALTAKKKAYTGYRFTKSKISSKYRSLKKRK